MLALFAGVAAVTLGLIVLTGSPANVSDLLAGGLIAAGAGLIFGFFVPPSRHGP